MPPLLISICLYSGIVKVAARLLRYKVSWKLSFLFALAMLIIAIASRALQFAIGYSLPAWLALPLLFVKYAVLGAWLFGQRATNTSGQVLGWLGSVRLSACAFLVMAVFALLLLGVSLIADSFHPITPPYPIAEANGPHLEKSAAWLPRYAVVAYLFLVKSRERSTRTHIYMSSVSSGLVSGTIFGAVAVAMMLPMSFPDKSSALLAAFCSRFAIGFVIACVEAPTWPGWAVGLLFGVLLSLPDAIITKAYAPILMVGAVGGLIIGGILHGWHANV